jgi:PAS domain S-box-containing protein
MLETTESTQIRADRPTVLVVDDSAAGRYSLARALRAHGFDTVETAGGAQALELAAKHHVSAVVLDVHLPDLHGFEVCRLIRSRPETATLPVIHVSAVYVESSHQVDGLAAGADAYLLSPVDPPVLAAMLDSLIRAHRLNSDARRRESRFRGVFEAADCAMLLLDANGCIAEVNGAFASLVDRQRERLPGRPLADLAPRESRDELARLVEGWRAGPWRGEFALTTARSVRVPLSWVVSPHPEPGFSIAVALPSATAASPRPARAS